MTFIHRLPIRPHPFPLLLQVEWVLLGVTTLGLLEVPFALLMEEEVLDPEIILDITILSALIFLWVGLFGVMGLRLPMDKKTAKLTYLGLEIGLIGLATYTADCFYCFSPLLLILIIRSCLMYATAERWAIAISTFIYFSIAQYLDLRLEGQFIAQDIAEGFSDPSLLEEFALLHDPLFLFQLWIQGVLFFGLVLIFVFLLVNALLAERQSRQELAIAHDQLRQYAQRIEDQATLQERNRIAREIHDSLGHLLTAQSLQLENALFFLADPEKTKTFIGQGKQLCSEALNELRRSVAMLRSDPLQGKDLEEAIATLLQQFQQTTDIALNYDLQLHTAIPKDLNTTLYRIIEEALTNICKHSQAQSVDIQLLTAPSSSTPKSLDTTMDRPRLYLSIRDNGQGFVVAQNTRGFGLQGIQERVTSTGGQFTITSAPSQGCSIVVIIPLPRTLPGTVL
ncbi:MAG: sensor histidine kinase [Cyanobacteria bacterium P01_F01_bin.150]